MSGRKLAFCLFKYVPFGGMQRDLLRIARACLAREYQVDVYTSAWKGKLPEDLTVSILPVWRFSNHRRCESFARKLGEYLADKSYDLVVGFNKTSVFACLSKTLRSNRR